MKASDVVKRNHLTTEIDSINQDIQMLKFKMQMWSENFQKIVSSNIIARTEAVVNNSVISLNMYYVKEQVIDKILSMYPSAVVTSTLGGVHSAGSRHYTGEAVDIDFGTEKENYEAFENIVANQLVPYSRIIYERNHLHIQLVRGSDENMEFTEDIESVYNAYYGPGANVR